MVRSNSRSWDGSTLTENAWPKEAITMTANALTKVAVAELKHNRGGSRRTNARSKPILASLFAVVTPGVALTDEDITTLSAAYAHCRCFGLTHNLTTLYVCPSEIEPKSAMCQKWSFAGRRARSARNVRTRQADRRRIP